MTTTFDNKADILVQFGWAYFDEPNFAELVEEKRDIIDLAHDHISRGVTLTPAQKQSVESFFAELVKITGHEDIGFTELEDFFVPNYDGEGHTIMGWERSPLLDAERPTHATEYPERSGADCGKCGASVSATAKFCASCGTKVERPGAEPAVTLAALTESMRGVGEELDSGAFKLLLDLEDDRTQLVFALPVENSDGQEELNDIQLWSNFATVESVSLARVVEITEANGFGFCQIGDYYSVTTAIRPWQLSSIEAFDWHVTRLALLADELEAELLGTDEL